MTAPVPPPTHDLLGLLPSEVDALLALLDEPSYRAAQLLRALYRDLLPSLAGATTLPLALRQRLDAAGWRPGAAREVAVQQSTDGDTTKLLLEMAGGTQIETVLMQYPADRPGRHPRSTVCVSTQAGCAMRCVFCATGQMGFARNLSAAEIVVQVVSIARLLQARGEHVTNVVFMGMGEPLANYDETIRAVRILTDPRAFALAQRAITISTVGVVRGIDRLAAEDLQVGLAISLHAADDALRRELVPTAGPHSVSDLIDAAARYFAATGRRISFEYALIAGVNDGPEHAAALAALLQDTGAHVNLIPLNPTAGPFLRPGRSRVLAFQRILLDGGITATVRVEKGVEIAAACGQLRTEVVHRPRAVVLAAQKPPPSGEPA